MGKVLNWNDFKEAVETCENQRYSYGVETFVDDFLKMHHEQNRDIISSLMEYVIKIFPEIMESDVWDFYKQGMIDFEEEAGEYDRPQLRFLYSYLIHLGEIEAQPKTKELIVPTVTKPVIELPKNNSLQKTFITNLSEGNLDVICDLLVRNGYISALDPYEFRKIFSAVPIDHVISKIRWIKSLQEGNLYNQSLFLFLQTIIPQEDYFNPDFCKKVASCFTGPDGTDLTYRPLDRAYDDYNRKKPHNKILTHLSKLLEPFSSLPKRS